MIPVSCLLVLSALLFFIGVFGFVTRRNLVAMLISVELVLNAADLNFAVFNRFLYPGELDGFFFTLFSIGVSAAETAVAIAIMGTMGYVNNAVNPETGAAFIDVNLISWEHTLQIRSLVAILYLVAGIILFVGLGLIYNLDKKTLDQMNTELAARKK